jgi:hypothetical protein
MRVAKELTTIRSAQTSGNCPRTTMISDARRDGPAPTFAPSCREIAGKPETGHWPTNDLMIVRTLA